MVGFFQTVTHAIITELRGLTMDNYKVKARLGNTTVRPCLKKKKRGNQFDPWNPCKGERTNIKVIL